MYLVNWQLHLQRCLIWRLIHQAKKQKNQLRHQCPKLHVTVTIQSKVSENVCGHHFLLCSNLLTFNKKFFKKHKNIQSHKRKSEGEKKRTLWLNKVGSYQILDHTGCTIKFWYPEPSDTLQYWKNLAAVWNELKKAGQWQHGLTQVTQWQQSLYARWWQQGLNTGQMETTGSEHRQHWQLGLNTGHTVSENRVLIQARKTAMNSQPAQLYTLSANLHSNALWEFLHTCSKTAVIGPLNTTLQATTMMTAHHKHFMLLTTIHYQTCE